MSGLSKARSCRGKKLSVLRARDDHAIAFGHRARDARHRTRFALSESRRCRRCLRCSHRLRTTRSGDRRSRGRRARCERSNDRPVRRYERRADDNEPCFVGKEHARWSLFADGGVRSGPRLLSHVRLRRVRGAVRELPEHVDVCSFTVSSDCGATLWMRLPVRGRRRGVIAISSSSSMSSTRAPSTNRSE